MSVSSVSTQAAGALYRPSLQQILAAQLSRLSATTDQTDTNADGTNTSTTAGQAACAGPGGDMTGSSSTQLSDGILNVLFQIQQQSTATAADGTTASDASSTETPLQSFLAAMDTDGDNQISQSEFETYLTKNGATKEQADKIFSSVDSDGSGGISSDELSKAVENGRPAGRPHGHHGHHGLDDIANSILQSLDADGDGTVSETDLESFVTAKGGTADQADKDFAALDINGDGALTKDELTQKLAELLPKPVAKSQKTSASDTTASTTSQSAADTQSSAWLRLLDALASAPSATASKTSTVAIAA